MIFYNGRDNWNPLELLEKDYPAYFHGMVLPFRCVFVNMSDIPVSDCLACEDVTTGLGIAAMAHAYDKNAILEVFNQFKPKLQKMPDKERSCLLEKISVYLTEYLDKDALKELNMAFKSIGQKYGFVSAGDVFRQEIADAQAMAENAKAELAQNRDDTETVLREMGISDEQIAEMQAKLEALRQSRLSRG